MEKRFIGCENDKKSEQALRSVLYTFAGAFIMALALKTPSDDRRFWWGVIMAAFCCLYVIRIECYTYGSVEIASDGIHYRNAFFVKKVLKWSDIGKVYKAEAFIGSGEKIDVICCTVGNKERIDRFEFDLAVFKEGSYFIMGYCGDRIRRVFTYYLESRKVIEQHKDA